MTPFLVIGSFEEEQVVQIVWDLLHTIGTLSLTSMEPVSKKGVYYRNSLTISAIELRVFESHPKCLILHTGANTNFLSRNYQEFDVWKM